tara:strand:- start:63 stop:902 length:840 start_codon:yes stop_codon:yes gene_type:complete
MAQDNDIVERLEKQIEGSNLALAAVAEVLHKMDSRISKQEDYELEMAESEEDAFEKQEIIKAVAGEVYGLIKADQGMPDLDKDGSAKERKAGSMAKGKDDSEKAVTVVSKLPDQQAAIQAMQKQLNLLKEEWGKEEDEDMEEENGDEEGEEEEEEEGFGMARYAVENAEQYPGLEQMQKQINDLKSLMSGSFDMQKAIQKETEGRLRKMGFREETSLTRPTLIRYEDSMGTDGTTPIQKEASGEDTVDQMMQLSYQDLRRLQETIESGETDGVPRELIG